MKKKWVLPIVAAILVVAAVLVVVLKPKKTETVVYSPYPERNADGDIVIKAADLSSDKVSFIKIAEDSKIELLARIGDDGKVKVTLGTCQSCNGSPYAYFTQEGNELICNNCGLHFPLNVLDSPGVGCHPISLPDTVLQSSKESAVLNTEALMQYEPLFAKVIEH